MSTSPRQSILDNIETTLTGISKENNYNFDIQKIVKGKIVPVHRVSVAWRESYIAFIYGGQANDRRSTTIMSTVMEVQIYAAMANETSANFMLFLDDIEASLAKDPTRNGLATTSYNVIDSYITSITVFDSQEADEVLSPTDQQYKQREAMIGFNVSYSYHADKLSGVS
jgi:hypothetical protein